MRIDGGELDWWWETDRYDTPLAGVVYFEGRPYYVKRISEWGNWIVDGKVLKEGEFDDWFAAVPIKIMAPWRIDRWLFNHLVYNTEGLARPFRGVLFNAYYNVIGHIFNWVLIDRFDRAIRAITPESPAPASQESD